MAAVALGVPSIDQLTEGESKRSPVDIHQDRKMDTSSLQAHLAVPTVGRSEHSTRSRKAYEKQIWSEEFRSGHGSQAARFSSTDEGNVPFYQPKLPLPAGREAKRASLPRSEARPSAARTSSRLSVVSAPVPLSPSVLGQGEEWQTQFFKTKLCPYHLEGRCINGTNCRFAHNPTELRPLPDLHRTKLCESYVRKEPCRNACCPFAHNPCELRTSSYSFYKVTLCNFYKKGRCWNGMHCRFAHGTSELQAASDEGESQSSEHPYAKSQFQGDAQKLGCTTSSTWNKEDERLLSRGNGNSVSSYSVCLPNAAVSPAVTSNSHASAPLLKDVSASAAAAAAAAAATGASLEKPADSMQQIISTLVQLLQSSKLGSEATYKAEKLAFDGANTESYPSFGVLPSPTSATLTPPWSSSNEEYWTAEGDKSGRFFDLDRLVSFVDMDDAQNVRPHGEPSQSFQDTFDKQWKDEGETMPSPVITPVPNRELKFTSKLLMDSASMTPQQTADRYASRHLAAIASISAMDKRRACDRPNHAAIF